MNPAIIPALLALRQRHGFGEPLRRERAAAGAADALGGACRGERELILKVLDEGLPQRMAAGEASDAILRSWASHLADSWLLRLDAALDALRCWREAILFRPQGPDGDADLPTAHAEALRAERTALLGLLRAVADAWAADEAACAAMERRHAPPAAGEGTVFPRPPAIPPCPRPPAPGIPPARSAGGGTSAPSVSSTPSVPAAPSGSAAGSAGMADVCRRFGLAYERGDGVPQDYETAFEWHWKSALLGHAEATEALERCAERTRDANGEIRCRVGRMHERGMAGVPRDAARACEWYARAAEHGHAWARKRRERLLGPDRLSWWRRLRSWLRRRPASGGKT